MCKLKIIGLGEVLWDIFVKEGDVRLGGAPANFAYFANALGNDGIVVSRIGNDLRGAKTLDELHRLNLSCDYIQCDHDKPTGTVNVTTKEDGSHEFEIIQDVAWDYLEPTPELLALCQDVNAICFGSLAQRSPITRQTIQMVLSKAKNACRVFDINIRQQFYTREVVEQSLRHSHALKLNDEELQKLKDLFEMSSEASGWFIGHLSDKFNNLRLVSLTFGEFGCVLRTKNAGVYSPGYDVGEEHVDSVGSGDAFAAAIVSQIVPQYVQDPDLKKLDEDKLREIADFANLLGAYVACHRGATPLVTDLCAFKEKHDKRHRLQSFQSFL